MSNYIIFGGTFDPIHNGHLKICKAAAKKYDAKIIFVPSKSPRWKNPSEDINHRLNMLKIALEGADFSYEICDFEINSTSEINYSIDTVKYLKNIYKDDKLYFLIGEDQVNQFDKWKDAKELSNLVQIVCTNRPDSRINNKIIKEFNMENLNYYKSGDVSSTKIRELKSVDLPLSVLFYIEQNKLYFIKRLSEFLPEKRLNHSIEVANLALKVAISNKLDNPEIIFAAALLHDLGKTYSKEDENCLSIMEKFYPEYLEMPKFAYHQFVGEHLAEKEFNITNPVILDAIKFHCTGKANMSDVGMIVYTCDKIEPTREFDSTWLINSTLKNYKNGFLMTLEDNKKYLLEHNKDISNKLTDQCFEMYLNK